MSRLLVLFFVLLMPLQSAWSAASAYCQHETSEQQGRHFGHHVHAHQGDAKNGTASPLTADADCATCHAAGAVAISTQVETRYFATASSLVRASALLPFTSALARAPDRPQWLRLV